MLALTSSAKHPNDPETVLVLLEEEWNTSEGTSNVEESNLDHHPADEIVETREELSQYYSALLRMSYKGWRM